MDKQISNKQIKSIYCQNCGQELNVDYKFCPHCGKVPRKQNKDETNNVDGSLLGGIIFFLIIIVFLVLMWIFNENTASEPNDNIRQVENIFRNNVSIAENTTYNSETEIMTVQLSIKGVAMPVYALSKYRRPFNTAISVRYLNNRGQIINSVNVKYADIYADGNINVKSYVNCYAKIQAQIPKNEFRKYKKVQIVADEYFTASVREYVGVFGPY